MTHNVLIGDFDDRLLPDRQVDMGAQYNYKKAES